MPGPVGARPGPGGGGAGRGGFDAIDAGEQLIIFGNLEEFEQIKL